MNKDLSLWQFIAKRLKTGKAVMLLVVTESSGSSPGRQGFKMAVADDDMKGSIGGGIMEIKLVELAKKLLKEKSIDPLIKKQIHNKRAPRDQSGMICSGEQTVIYFKLDNGHLPEVRKVIRVLGKYESAMIHISYEGNISSFHVADRTRKSSSFEFEKVGDKEFTYRENIGYRNRLFIVGGGHCALALSELMSKFDFYIHVIDNRPDLNTIEQNTFAHEKHIIDSYESIDQVVPSGKDVFVVVMTLGYRTDLTVLLKLIDKSFAYIGMLGSQSKVKTLMKELTDAGYSKKELKQIHAPIGIKIDSHTPEEIAVSIAAEIIKVRNKN